MTESDDRIPLLRAKDHGAPSAFLPENLLREGRRQRGLPDVAVPAVCLLDPDGDIVRYLDETGTGVRHPGWACYHTALWSFDLDCVEVGVVGSAVGAPFAVLVAEQLAASGCLLVISVTSAGSITPVADPPYFVLIDRALRDEGTSHHYVQPGEWSDIPAHLITQLDGAFDDVEPRVVVGSTWTTDAPYRETAQAIARAKAQGVVAVEMEAAALYAFAAARQRAVVCIAHVTNAMATAGDDFEKGEADGVHDALAVVTAVIGRLPPLDARPAPSR